ncbi:hypothetical protein B0H17DRAFT_1030404 [Mycena rosella]|uniref:Calpain catalytic domain-containing protein n=1 Tax=Mycena rosella TaxID=1033263 RepID=A0AAD7MAX7_MYCRO|nr:hypothetical protein B0H17DRAFT_1030404 [Mycena rosella]
MNLRNQKRRADKAGKASFLQEEKRAGLLVTDELEKALAECTALVERIALDCRAQNRRFRDVEFDLENDRERCLFGLSREDREYSPSDVHRATKIFKNPSFFVDGADSNDIVQGRLGDCWLLSALSTMSTAKGLIEKFCVARDEKVGVYGFIFFRDSSWVTVIIDDLLFTSIPKFEELTPSEQTLYHRDKTLYNTSARTGGKSLYFARSGTEGETWVPLLEKAYAKLHGDYASISGGFSCEAIEDLTGRVSKIQHNSHLNLAFSGVSTFIPTKDILDPNVFWEKELLLATTDRLFGCGFDTLDSTRSGNPDVTVNGLIGGHAYSVLRAVEYNGTRFVVLRNPWGDSEWTGPWSDGAKEWTEEWLPALKHLKHSFGDDGEFVMEYSDFLDNWDLVERTLLFDDTWVMSSQWLQVTARAPSSAWSYGDISFTISIPAPTKTVIVLSKLDERYFSDISGNSCWTFDFVLFKKGEKAIVAQSRLSRFYLRSVNLEVPLEQGEYVVHVRLDRQVNDDVQSYHPGSNCDTRKFARVQTERAKSQSVASNFKPSAVLDNLPIPLDVLAGQDLTELETKVEEAEKRLKAAEAALRKADSAPEAPRKDASDAKKKEKEPITEETATETTIALVHTTTKTKPMAQPKKPVVVSPDADTDAGGDYEDDNENTGADFEVDLDNIPTSIADEDLGLRSAAGSPVPAMWDVRSGSDSDSDSDSEYQPELKESGYSNDTVVLGLRVYTRRDAPAVVGGQLRHKMKACLVAVVESAL